MSVPPLLRHPVTLYVLGCFLLLFSAFLLAEHAAAVRQFTTLTLPLMAEIPSMERRLRVLEDQAQAAELQAMLSDAAEEEAVRAFVFPSGPNIPRLMAFFDVLRDDLLSQDLLLTLSEITVGEAEGVADMPDLRRIPLSLAMRLRPGGLERVLWFLDHAGAVTVADILFPEEIDLLLLRAEEENPSSIVALEQFLSTDVLRYVREPKPFEEHVQRSFVGDGFRSAFADVREGSLAAARSFLGGRLGVALEEEHLWPLRALRVMKSDVQLEDGVYRLSLDLEAYARVES